MVWNICSLFHTLGIIPSGKLTVCYWTWPSRNSGCFPMNSMVMFFPVRYVKWITRRYNHQSRIRGLHWYVAGTLMASPPVFFQRRSPWPRKNGVWVGKSSNVCRRVPSGKRLHSNGKIHHAINGKISTISMAMFNCYVSSPEGSHVYRRVSKNMMVCGCV